MSVSKYRTIVCKECDFEETHLMSDAEFQHIEGQSCPECGDGKLIKGVGRVNMSSQGGKTNFKTTGWFNDRMKQMKKAFPNSNIGSGAADFTNFN